MDGEKPFLILNSYLLCLGKDKYEPELLQPIVVLPDDVNCQCFFSLF